MAGSIGLAAYFSSVSLEFPVSWLLFFSVHGVDSPVAVSDTDQWRPPALKALNIKLFSSAWLQKFQRSLVAVLWIDVVLRDFTVE